MKSLSEIFRSDAFVQNSAVFSDIDKDRLAKDLNLKNEGTKRGANELPKTNAKTLDHLEMKIIARVEDLRRRGLENYETHRQVYSERLNKATSARLLIETEANDSKAKFSEEVVLWKNKVVTSSERVREAFKWRDQFRKNNNLQRPAKKVASLVSLIGLASVIIVFESAGNAYLFAQKNTMGLLGGLMAAFLVSVGNVSLSIMLGMATRYINCWGVANLHKKLFGFIFFLWWIAFALIYNSGVAHFRDAVERVAEWRDAGTAAIQSLLNNPASLYTIESYVLFVVGILISVLSFLEGYNHSDPYPGYAKVAQDVIDARNDYIDHLENSIETLRELREDAASGLRDANEQVDRNINDSVDALYGERALNSNLSPFLEQCDIAANYLLSLYREANQAARKDNPPVYFKKDYKFEPFKITPPDIARRQEAEKQAREVSELVNHSIADMDKIVEEARKSFDEIDELEETYIDRSARSAQHNTEQKVVCDDGQETE